MDRVVVVGCSGAGKTTVARRLAETLGVPNLEMDGVFHQPGWVPLEDSSFQARLAEFTAGERWVVDGNYTSHGTRDVVWPRADTFVWLDFSRGAVMRNVIGRTLKRVLTREELWNGNKEPWTNLYSLDPYENIIVWSWTRFHKYRDKYEKCLTDGTWAHATVHRLTSRDEVDELLSSIERPTPR